MLFDNDQFRMGLCLHLHASMYKHAQVFTRTHAYIVHIYTYVVQYTVHTPKNSNLHYYT